MKQQPFSIEYEKFGLKPVTLQNEVWGRGQQNRTT
jgi:hypothetical protein